MMRDADFGIVRLRAFGTYDFRIVDVKKFLKEVAGTDDHFRLDEFNDTMRSRIVSVFTDALASAKIPALDVASRYGELGDALLPLINPAIGEKYGLEMTSFVVENVSVPPEVEQAIDKRSSMAAVGNLNDYVKFQMAQGMEKGGGGGVGGVGAETGGRHGDGAADDEPDGRHHGAGHRRASRRPRAGRRRQRRRTLMTPAQVAQMLGVGRVRRDGEPRGGRPEGQEDRHAVARHARRRRRVPESHEDARCAPDAPRWARALVAVACRCGGRARRRIRATSEAQAAARDVARARRRRRRARRAATPPAPSFKDAIDAGRPGPRRVKRDARRRSARVERRDAACRRSSTTCIRGGPPPATSRWCVFRVEFAQGTTRGLRDA